MSKKLQNAEDYDDKKSTSFKEKTDVLLRKCAVDAWGKVFRLQVVPVTLEKSDVEGGAVMTK